MTNISGIDSEFFQWVILPFLIFLARLTDVSIGTIRIILIAKGKKYIASILGFFEILIWLLAIRQIFINLTNPLCYIAYAGGFAMGNFVGMIIEEKIAIGFEVIRIITKKDASELIRYFHDKGYGTTSIEAAGSTGQVHVIFTIANRRVMPEIIKGIKRFNPKAFYTIEDVRTVSQGIFPEKQKHAGAFAGK